MNCSLGHLIEKNKGVGLEGNGRSQDMTMLVGMTVVFVQVSGEKYLRILHLCLLAWSARIRNTFCCINLAQQIRNVAAAIVIVAHG